MTDRQGGVELNLDGLVGPTHSYAGLSYGNLASQRSRREASSPRQAASEGLAKMRRLADLGVPQAVLPPHERPDVEALRRLGFAGATDAAVLERAYREDPSLLAACYSASGMWAANAATVSPSADAADGRVHFTPANLVSQFHRSLEPKTTSNLLRAIFRDDARFAHHPPLPAASPFADEGAANHIRLCPSYDRGGLQAFVYGRSSLQPDEASPRRFPARQTREASAAVARLHDLSDQHFVLLRQHPEAIDAGAFHNDVVAVGNLDLLFAHERAFADGDAALEAVRRGYRRTCGDELAVIGVSDADVPLADAVGSYLFNSQIVRTSGGGIVLVAPAECATHPRVRPYLDGLLERGGPFGAVEYVNVRQSMRNGGGPACLRLRVALTAEELAAVHPGVMLNDASFAGLSAWIERHYRDDLHPDDLRDPRLLQESRDALDALTALLGLGSVYRFQGATAP